MASNPALDSDRHDHLPPISEQLQQPLSPWGAIKLVLTPIASLRVTVVLFVMLIIIVFVGTLAQAEESMKQAVDRYFYSLFLWIEFRTLFPRSFFPWFSIPGGWGFPFLGGGAIGASLLINLLAAHVVRFTIQAKGLRLAIGLVVIVAGLSLIGFVIYSGQNSAGLQGVPSFVTSKPSLAPHAGGQEVASKQQGVRDWQPMWFAMKNAVLPMLILGAAACCAALVLFGKRIVEAVLSGIIAAALLALGIVLWVIIPTFALDDSALRILWQLTQGGLAAVVLAVGCVLAFKQRGGMVVLHAGVGLLMVGMFFVAYYAVEEQMTIEEGESTNEALNINFVELAIVDHTPKDHDDVVAVPESRLVPGKRITDKALPFDVQLVQYMPNTARFAPNFTQQRPLKPGERTPATTGFGTKVAVDELPVGAGAEAGGDVDYAAAYVRFLEKGSGDDLGTYLVSQTLAPQEVKVGGKSYDVDLRFKTTPKPYTIELLDVSKDDYMGTDTPMNYSSWIHLVDPRNNEDRKVNIWMNNPLRYAGETFYQTNYIPAMDGHKERTVLSIVTNTGWMAPYVACMVVGVGMLVHFWTVLVRFLKRLISSERRRSENEQGEGQIVDAELTSGPVRPAHRPAKRGKGGRRRETPVRVERPGVALAGIIGPGIAAVVVLGCFSYAMQPPSQPDYTFNYYAAGEIPIMYQGRIKPLDTLARNSLLIVSDREYFYDKDGDKQPAMRWLLDVVSGSPEAQNHEVFRIDNLEVLDVLGLKRRKGFRYSVGEIYPGIQEFEKQVQKVRALKERKVELSAFQSKLLEVDRRISAFTMLVGAFHLPRLPSLYQEGDDAFTAIARRERFQRELARARFEISSRNPPLAVPGEAGESWQPYSLALIDDTLIRAANEHSPPDEQIKRNPRMAALYDVFDSYDHGDFVKFNAAVKAYREMLEKNPPEQLAMPVVWYEQSFRPVTNFEAYFNNVAPFTWCMWLYVFATALTFVGFLLAQVGWNQPFRRAALTIMILTFLFHTAAIAARMYISGRPPVTNLYSSAVFIGWFGVLLCIGLEFVSRFGIGNLVGSVIGLMTMIIAGWLSGDGDTMAVLQAVLDTQFWLATHVVSITAGYGATFIAGALGIVTIGILAVIGVMTHLLGDQMTDESKRSLQELVRVLHKMTYGIVCFAILFSFIGTVLGGLWADDSWGRFWGWDPKENGAAMIVIWNAIVLHARWGRMVGDRGFAMLAVGGNIVTAWSWFGVNELGVGLHSYGFTEGVKLALTLFVVSQLVVIAIGAIPWGRLSQNTNGRGAAAET